MIDDISFVFNLRQHVESDDRNNLFRILGVENYRHGREHSTAARESGRGGSSRRDQAL